MSRIPLLRLGRDAFALAMGVLVALGAAAGDPPGAGREPGPEEDYLLNCSGCHGPSGEGSPDVVPSFEDLGEILDAPGGREYVVRVPGSAQAPISGARLARLLNWLIERHVGAAPDPRYAADEVARLRATPLRNAAAFRRALDIGVRRP